MKPVFQTRIQARPAEEPLFPDSAGCVLEQIGSFDLPALAAGPGAKLRLADVTSPAGLEAFLCDYAGLQVAPIEFPLIARAYACAARGQARELIALDQEAGKQLGEAAFAGASRRIGRDRLRQLRPLRDHRVAQRYLTALESGAAQGWNPVVFGLFLSIYSTPPRQGLLRYGEAALTGLAESAARECCLPAAACEGAVAAAMALLPKGIEKAVALI